MMEKAQRSQEGGRSPTPTCTHPPGVMKQLSGYRDANMHYPKASRESRDPGYSHPHGLTSWAL